MTQLRYRLYFLFLSLEGFPCERSKRHGDATVMRQPPTTIAYDTRTQTHRRGNTSLRNIVPVRPHTHQRTNDAEGIVYAALRLIQHQSIGSAHEDRHRHARGWHAGDLHHLMPQQRCVKRKVKRRQRGYRAGEKHSSSGNTFL